MARKTNKEELISEIEMAFDFGRFISYNDSWNFVRQLDKTKDQVDELVRKGKSMDAVPLYEMFLAGCREKIEDIDDSSGGLGDFFQELFCSWIKARQKAKLKPEETVGQILKWMENDDYGLCYRIEKYVAATLNKKGLILFKTHFQNLFQKALAPYKSRPPKYIFDYPQSVYVNAQILKEIYIANKDVHSYLDLCEKIAISPKDCEDIAKIQITKRKYAEAFEIVEKGIAIESSREWHNQSSCSLSRLRQELLPKLGRKDEAIHLAWADFELHPSAYTYDNYMQYIQKAEKRKWQEKAMTFAAQNASMSDLIELCRLTNELDILTEHILSTDQEKLNDISHYILEPAAQAVTDKSALAAAKLYTAMGLRIVNRGKSKYYRYAFQHFEKAMELYKISGQEPIWQSIIQDIRETHSRKYSFIGNFETIVAGRWTATKPDSFRSRLKKRWKNQLS